MLLAGAPTDLSFLDPVDEADAPPQAVRLAAGELLLRIAEERRRRAAGLGAAGDAVPQRRMTGKAGARPNSAVYVCGGIAVCGAWLPVRCGWVTSVVLAAVKVGAPTDGVSSSNGYATPPAPQARAASAHQVRA